MRETNENHVTHDIRVHDNEFISTAGEGSDLIVSILYLQDN